jgi:hypothetical protein
MKTMKKSLAVVVILVFIGVAIAPSINFNVKASNDNDLVEITSQACGITGFGNTTVKLTEQQCQDLKQYLVDFRARVNQTTTREEAVPLFKEAIIVLNTYGLLPKGMSVHQAQWLATGGYLNVVMKKFQEKIYHIPTRASDNNSNYLCLIVGDHRGAFLMHVAVNTVLMQFFMLCYPLRNITFFNHICQAIEAVYMGRFIYSIMIPIFPLPSLGTGIFFTFDVGSIKTIGLLGEKKWEGGIIGGYRQTIEDYYGLGVKGFTGFHITLQAPPFLEYDMIFFGSALAVNLVYY